MDIIDIIVIIYLDEILIYSNNIYEHKAHVQEVLHRLCTNGLFAYADKCKFHVTSCKYLRYMLSPEGLTMALYKVQIIQDWPEPQKVKDIQSFLSFANFYCCFIYGYSKITIPLMHLTTRVSFGTFPMSAVLPLKHLKKAFTTALVLTHWILDTQITVNTDASDYALTTVLSIMTPNGELHPISFHSWMFWLWNSTMTSMTKSYSQFFEAFKWWWHYLEGSGLLINVVTNHQNLWYFSLTKILTCQQAHWSEYLSGFNLIIYFCPRKLGTKPDALTRRWDIYLKEGNSNYATSVNPQNYCPVFTSEQLASSFQATTLSILNLCGSLIMDSERVHSKIQCQLWEDPISAEHLNNQSEPWTLDPDGLLWNSGCIYVLDSRNLQLHVLEYSHDHPLQDILVRQRHSTKSTCTTIGLDILPTSKTTANHVPLVPMPNLCTINLMDFSSNFQFPRSLGIPYQWIS